MPSSLAKGGAEQSELESVVAERKPAKGRVAGGRKSVKKASAKEESPVGKAKRKGRDE